MLSDEEKKAIEILGEFKKNGFHLLNLRYESRVSTTKHIENSIETILNLIEKQSKEIEELKEENKELSDKLTEKICKGVEEELLEEYRQTIISKDKEIEELKASHIITNNKATNTEKAKIFDIIENSIDTYIENSKPY